MDSLKGKVAVITGGTRGLGFEIARAYLKAGAAVVIGSRSAHSVEEALTRLRNEGEQVSGLATDVADMQQVQALARHALELFGQIDIWVNNAGLAGMYGATSVIDPAEFERVLRTNIMGTYYGSMVALHHFLPRNTGKLINILGHGDRQPVPYQNAYASSKVWVRHFTLMLAQEHKHTGVSIFAYNPGLTDTALLRKVEAVRGYENRLKRFGFIIRILGRTPEASAQKALWLAGTDTDGKTGLEVRSYGPFSFYQGLLRDLWRRLRRQKGLSSDVEITVVEPYHMSLESKS